MEKDNNRGGGEFKHAQKGSEEIEEKKGRKQRLTSKELKI